MPEDRSGVDAGNRAGGGLPEDPAHVARTRVRYAETDQMGRAHHGVYVVWCEIGRTAMMRDRGVSYAELERIGVYLPVSRLEIAYRSAAHYDEEVTIETGIESVRSRAVTFTYRLSGSNDRPIATASTELVCVNANGESRRLPDEVRAALLAAGRPGASAR